MLTATGLLCLYAGAALGGRAALLVADHAGENDSRPAWGAAAGLMAGAVAIGTVGGWTLATWAPALTLAGVP
jgi:hypothetical protein